MEKKIEYIEKILDTYGLERLLEDAHITLPEALEVLDELGFIHLDMYDDD